MTDFLLKAAREFGAGSVIHAAADVPARLRELNDGRLADLVIVCAGAMPAAQQGVRSVERGGTILFFAPTAAGVEVPIPLFELWRDEVTITTSYAASPQDITQAIELIRG